MLFTLTYSLSLSYLLISSFLGQSLLGYVLPRRPPNHRSSWLKSQTPNLGRRSKRRSPQNLLSKAQRSRTRNPREARRWYRWCCERRWGRKWWRMNEFRCWDLFLPYKSIIISNMYFFSSPLLLLFLHALFFSHVCIQLFFFSLIFYLEITENRL